METAKQIQKVTFDSIPKGLIKLSWETIRTLSWEFRDSSHGDGLTEGLDGGDDGSGSGLRQRRHLGYPGLGPSTPQVKPLLPACFLLSSQWLQRSSSCSSRGGRRWIGSPRLRVQTPLYRQGSGYILGGRLPAPRGCIFGMIFWPSSVPF
jgi:hypothetical protein